MTVSQRLQKLSARQRERLAARVSAGKSNAAQQLIAYVVPATNARVSTAELRDFLSARLPGYMLPAHIVLMDALPKMPNGKVARHELPEPVAAAELDGDVIAPRTELERQLAGIWGALLGAEMLDVRDNFFELGGHSLLVTQLAARVRTAFAVALPVNAFFEAPTLEGQAARIAALKLAASSASLEAEREEFEL